MKQNKMKPTQAVITNTKTLPNTRTGDDQTLHDAYTIDGNFIQIWTDTPAPVAKRDEEVYVVMKTEHYEKNGTPVTRDEWHIIPTAFAERMIAPAPKKRTRRSK